MGTANGALVKGWSIVPVLPWLVVGAAFWFLYPLCDYFMLGTEDEMELLYYSHRILLGQFPHLDFFTPLPPLTFVSMAAWWSVVGESLFSARLLFAGVMGMAALLLFLLGSRLLPPWAAVVASLLFLTETVSWAVWSKNWLNAPVYLLTVLLLVRHAEKPGRLTMVAAGSGAGICFLNTQYIGVVALVLGTIVAFTELDWPSRRRRQFELGLGFVAILVPYLLVYAWAGALRGMWQEQFLFPLYGYADYNRFPYQIFPNLGLVRAGLTSVGGFTLAEAWQARGPLLDFFTWPTRTLLVHTLFYPLTLVFFLLAFVRWWTTGERVLCILSVGQLGLSLTTLTRPDEAHLAYARTLWWILLLALLLELWRRAPRAVAWTVVPVAGMAMMAVLIQGWLHHRRWADAAYRVRFPREVVRVREPQVAKALAVTIAMLDERSRPGEAIYIYPINPVFYFLTGRENPTSTERLLPFYDSPQQHDRIFSELEKADPRLKAILVFNIDFPMYLKQYPSVPAAEFEQIVRGFEKRMQDRFGDRVLHPPF